MKQRGGARKGAGRKAGAITKRTRQAAEQVIQRGLTPLQVMVEAMESAYNNGDLRGAAALAEKAAPYVHPRLSAVNAQTQVTGQLQIQVVSDFPDE